VKFESEKNNTTREEEENVYKLQKTLQQQTAAVVVVGPRYVTQSTAVAERARFQTSAIESDSKSRYKSLSIARSHSVMVSTLDFDSKDPSSNLGGTLLDFIDFSFVPYTLKNKLKGESNTSEKLLLYLKSQLVLIDKNKIKVPLIGTNYLSGDYIRKQITITIKSAWPSGLRRQTQEESCQSILVHVCGRGFEPHC
jgi:hypothetical protein